MGGQPWGKAGGRPTRCFLWCSKGKGLWGKMSCLKRISPKKRQTTHRDHKGVLKKGRVPKSETRKRTKQEGGGTTAIGNQPAFARPKNNNAGGCAARDRVVKKRTSQNKIIA